MFASLFNRRLGLCFIMLWADMLLACAAQLLALFHARLANGRAKGDALRASQGDWLQGEPPVQG